MFLVVQPAPEADGTWNVLELSATQTKHDGVTHRIPDSRLAEWVAAQEASHPRWAFLSTRETYKGWFERGIRVMRAHDITLVRRILIDSAFTHPEYRPAELPATTREPRTHVVSHLGRPGDPFSPQQALPTQASPSDFMEPLFDALPARPVPVTPEPRELARWLAQNLEAIETSAHPAKLRLLASAESAGALVATEMEVHGVPWDVAEHRRILEDALGPRPAPGELPRDLARLAAEVAAKLGVAPFNLDSPVDLIRALHRAGIEVKSTRSWELRGHKHPGIEPLLEYKKRARLMSANGWAWLDEWVRGGRFRPEYVVGGVVTGRWASRGGGALQIPHLVRSAVVPGPSRVLIVADAAQLEPRILAALSRDAALAAAGWQQDLYQGTADRTFESNRAKAKVAILGAMYGASSGASGALKPQLARDYPRAIALVEAAARAGERGEAVHTYLGRTTPPLDEAWAVGQRSETAGEERRARSLARSRGRFTRNFVVQGTAAEWALCWLAEIRRRVVALSAEHPDLPACELVFFLHDEVMLHVPSVLAEEVEGAVRDAATAATRLVFGDIPVDFPLSVARVLRYSDAK
ncbi:bifunctional 3'-5' exonuclease/DNA polymerase [Haematomicrobium sanguinis]|uniref:bifunctional 3'-5' exonuclease/DNA polymerase n=1 Tax=Haematomicrobium sanguinis TaxID=479106 RepID=UPI00047EBC14|nr:bifunctional 3'-5' exonuclease/DNA polymerase [Haematomicrobium sanguinis]